MLERCVHAREFTTDHMWDGENDRANPGVLFCVESARHFRMRGANLLFGLALDGGARRLVSGLMDLFF